MTFISVILITVGFVSYFFTATCLMYPIRRKNLLIPVLAMKQIFIGLLPGFVILFLALLYTKSIMASLGITIAVYVIFFINLFLQKTTILCCRIIPTPRRKWFYEVILPNIMKTSETYPVRIILKPAAVELDHRGRRIEKVLQHIALNFEEEPIAESKGCNDLSGELWVRNEGHDEDEQDELLVDAAGSPILISTRRSSMLKMSINGPAFEIDPRESNVTLSIQPTFVEFLVTPSKSGKHLLAIEFHDELGRRGYLKTYIRVKDYILLRFIKLTEGQIKIIRATGYLIGIVGVVIGIIHTLGII